MLAITGINGLVGSALLRWFQREGPAGRPEHRQGPGTPRGVVGLSTRPPGASVLKLTDGRPERTKLPIRRLIHCGGLVGGGFSREQYLRANLADTENLLQWSRDNGLEHFIFFSTGGVYGPAEGWVDEDSPLKPEGDYAQSKAWAEEEVLASSLQKVTVIRLYFPIGPFDRCHFFADLDRRLAEGTAFLNDAEGHPWIPPIDLDDLAPVLAAVLDQGLEGVFNLSGNVALTIREIADLLAEVGGFAPIRPPDRLKAGENFLGRSDKIIRAAALKPFASPMAALRRRALENKVRKP